MPELPEVETVVQDLQFLTGQKLKKLQINDARVWFESELESNFFQGKKLQAVARRGKYLVYDFVDCFLVQHLRMTGKMLAADSELLPREPSKRKQIRLEMSFSEADLVFYDTRRFGTFTAVKNLENYWQKKAIAPDAFAKSERLAAKKLFLSQLRLKKRPIKSALLDQSLIAGVGNIYADEALHSTKIHPMTPCGSISVEQSKALFAAIIAVFQAAIKKRGTTQSDYFDVSGNPGIFKKYLKVYRRFGDPCKSCGQAEIDRLKIAGRSSHFCPQCQKLPKE